MPCRQWPSWFYFSFLHYIPWQHLVIMDFCHVSEECEVVCLSDGDDLKLNALREIFCKSLTDSQLFKLHASWNSRFLDGPLEDCVAQQIMGSYSTKRPLRAPGVLQLVVYIYFLESLVFLSIYLCWCSLRIMPEGLYRPALLLCLKSP